MKVGGQDEKSISSLLHNSNEHSIDLKNHEYGGAMRNLSRETGYRLQNFLTIRCHRENWFVRKTRAPAVIKKGKKKFYKKSLDLFERIYDETGCARPKDRRRKSEKQISIMRTSFSTIKAKLEVIERSV